MSAADAVQANFGGPHDPAVSLSLEGEEANGLMRVEEEVVKKLSSITKEIELSLNDTQGRSPKGDSPPLTNVTAPVMKAIDYNEIITPPQYRNHISLRGIVALASGISNLFEASKAGSQIGTEIGRWEGKWGMTDATFTVPHGIVSPFSYVLSLGVDLGEDDSSNICANVMLNGFFKVKAVRPSPDGDPYIEVKESSVVLKLTKGVSPDIAQVSGSGENQYGPFQLIGQYNFATNGLNCYRQYAKTGVKPRPRKQKRKSAPSLGGNKRQRQDSMSSMCAPSSEKRERKTPAHLKDSLNMKTLKPKKDNVMKTAKGLKTEIDALKEMVSKLMESDRERFFSQPVDPIRINCPDYFDVIKYPMDLGTVSEKLQKSEYVDLEEGARDVRLVFTNAMTYNPVKHPVHRIANMHLKHFERDLKKFSKEQEKLNKLEMKRKEAKARTKSRAKEDSLVHQTKEQQAGLAKMNKLLLKSKKSMMAMFSSSEEEESDNSDEDELLVPKKKKRKQSKGELDIIKKTMAMMSGQMEMMQQLQNNSLQEITRLNKELNASKQIATPQYQSPSPQYMPPAGMMPTYPMGVGNVQPGYGMNAPMVARKPTTSKPKSQKVKKPPKPLSYQQMKQLSDDIHRLPAEELPALLDILRDNNVDTGSGEEVELDLDKLSPEIARLVERFVAKTLAKAKRTAAPGDLKFD